MNYANGSMPETDPSARNLGMLCHLLALSGVLIPFGNLIGPLIVWLMKKKEVPFVDDQGKESLNFQITATLAMIILSPTICIGIGFVVLPALGIAVIVFSIIAGVAASGGTRYRYPATLRLIK
jgi:uncharacterized Tic20 family protein